MDAFVAERPSVETSSYVESPSFLFSSPHRSIEAFGVVERIRIPASGAQHPGGALQIAVESALDRARRGGQDNPIVVGAIPFDARLPSFLFAPSSYRAARAAPAPAGGTGPGHGARALRRRSVPDREGFEDAVTQAIGSFRAGKATKAVLSRILEIEFDERVNASAILDILRRQNPSAHHFHTPLPDGGVLLGASPELLIRKSGRLIHSNPLAGSAKRVADPDEDMRVGRRLLQSSKDNFEHRLVTDDIRRLLAPLCKTLTVPAEPALMSTPTMWHLSTAITGELDANMSALQLACLLHPTPAVCGAPTSNARALIERLEPFDRGFFSGLVGWCDEYGDGEWAIAIRCGTVNDMVVRLFAGAGIVEASDPNAEWAETEAKLATMLRAFGVDAEDGAS